MATDLIGRIRAGIERTGWSEVARRSRLERAHLHHVFGPNGHHNPKLSTIEAVLPAIGLALTLEKRP